MATGSLTALQLDAGAGLLQNQGIGINANLISAITSYETTGLIAPFLNTISTGAGNVLANSVISDLETYNMPTFRVTVTISKLFAEQ